MKKENELVEDFWVSQGGKPHLAADIEYYQSSWDMLMPVVRKIVLICDEIIALSTDWYNKYIRPMNMGLMRAHIQEVYDSVIEYIRWYNSQNS